MDDNLEELKAILNDQIIAKLKNLNEEFLNEHNQVLLAGTMLLIAKELERKNELLSDIKDFIFDTNDYLSELIQLLKENNQNKAQLSTNADSQFKNENYEDLQNNNEIENSPEQSTLDKIKLDDNEMEEIYISKSYDIDQQEILEDLIQHIEEHQPKQINLDIKEISKDIQTKNKDILTQKQDNSNEKTKKDTTQNTQPELESFNEECEIFIPR